MNPDFSLPLQIRWSDLDPNFHVRHSVYYDWGAMCRVHFLDREGLNAARMQALQFGPILFREECIFRREILSTDAIAISLEVLGARSDYSRWTIRHEIRKGDGTLAAQLTVEGAWLDVVRRKLATPPDEVAKVFEAMPRSAGFVLLP